MLADMAVAVNADDPRYTAVIGKLVRLPITGRLIPVIADEHADPELGSGAVKITPGHDFNDFEVGRRAGMKPGDMLNHSCEPNCKAEETKDGRVFIHAFASRRSASTVAGDTRNSVAISSCVISK